MSAAEQKQLIAEHKPPARRRTANITPISPALAQTGGVQAERGTAPAPVLPYTAAYACLTAQNRYYADERGVFRIKTSATRDGEPRTDYIWLSNFVPMIAEEVSIDEGGGDARLALKIDGWLGETPLKRIAVPIAQFAEMGWPLKQWGVCARIAPNQQAAAQLRDCTQSTIEFSPDFARRTEYAHTGWRQIAGEWVYLHGGGALGAGGVVPGVSVELEGSLGAYTLAAGADISAADGAAASREMLEVLPGRIAWPLLAVTYLAPLREMLGANPPAFALYLRGGTGTNKSTVSALALGHFGAGFTELNLPASFRSTANATMRAAFLLKDSLLCIDDFYPETDMNKRRQMNATAQQLARAAGDLAGRNRLNPDGTTQTARPPRCMAIMSGEDMPDIGQSGAARLFILEVKPGEVLKAGTNAGLTALQHKAHAGYLTAAMRGYIAWLAGNYELLAAGMAAKWEAYRDDVRALLPGAHGRAAGAVAHMLIGVEAMLTYWNVQGTVTDDELCTLMDEARGVLLATATAQAAQAVALQPVEMFKTALREYMAAHITGFQKIDPPQPTDAREFEVYPVEDTIGFADDKYYYLLAGQTYSAVSEYYRRQQTTFPISAVETWKRLAEEGFIEGGRGRIDRQKAINGRRIWVMFVPKERLEG